VTTVNNKLQRAPQHLNCNAFVGEARKFRIFSFALQKMDLAGLKSTELASAFFSCASVLQTWYAALALSKDDQ